MSPLRWLGVPPHAAGRALRVGLVHAVIGAAIAAGDALVQASVLSEVGVDALPEVLLARAVVGPVLAFAYARATRGRATAPVLAALSLVAGGVLLAGPSLLRSPLGSVGLYSAHEIATALLTVHWGVYLLDRLGSDARSSVALVYAMARGGAALAGALLPTLVGGVGTQTALPCAASLFGVVAIVCAWPKPARGATRMSAPADEDAPVVLDRGRSVGDYAHGHRQPPPRETSLWRAPLTRWLVASTVLLVLLRVILRFQQQDVLEAMDAEALAVLLGHYTLVANVVALAIQLLVTSRLLERLGVAKTNLLYAGAGLIAQVLLWLSPAGHLSVGAALGARFADGELKHALKTPVSPLFYDAFPASERTRARALVLGVVSPIAQVVAAALLMVLAAWAEWVPALGVMCAVLYLLLSIGQGRAYDASTRA